VGVLTPVEAPLVRVGDVLSGKAPGGTVRVRGWLYTRRSSGGIVFLILRDGTGWLQCVARREALGEEKLEELESLPVESVIELAGSVREDPRAPGGKELRIEAYRIISLAEQGFPIAKKYHGPDFLLENRHLWIRSKKMWCILMVRAKLLKAARDWLDEHGFVEAHAPILTASACEGGATLFPVDYFGQKAYLTQSWQLYGEAFIASLGKCYTIAPSFRAEKSRTRRHLTEYWHLEVEIPFCGLKELLEVEEEFITHICHELAEKAGPELEQLGRDPGYLAKIEPPFQRLTYDEAVERLQALGIQIEWGEDLTWTHERALSERFDEPFFITHFPRSAKAFYHKPDPGRPEVTLSADLLAPEGYGEITGGGERIEDYDALLKRIEEEGLDPADYGWYLDLRRYGSVQHAGFGLGVERMVMWVCKLEHIRDAIAFPRLVRRRPYP